MSAEYFEDINSPIGNTHEYVLPEELETSQTNATYQKDKAKAKRLTDFLGASDG